MDLSDPASFTAADSPLTLEDILGMPEYLDLVTPKLAVGDRAIDFTLPHLDSDSPITLSHFSAIQPVALIFGSYT
jgi:hypothetical protein